MAISKNIFPSLTDDISSNESYYKVVIDDKMFFF